VSPKQLIAAELPIEGGDRAPALRIVPVVFGLALLIFTSFSEFLMVAPILKMIGEALAIPEQSRGLLISSYGFCAAIATLVMGPVSDRYGRRQVLVWGSLAFGAATLSNGLLAHNFLSMLLLRALCGLTAGFLAGTVIAYIGDAFPYHIRGRVVGLVLLGSFGGHVLGVPFGAYSAALWGFRAPFVAFGALALFDFLLLWRVLPEPRSERPTEPLGWKLYRDKYWGLLQDAEVRTAVQIYLLLFIGFAMIIAYLPTWYMAALRIDERVIAKLFVAGGLGAMIGSPLSGALSDRIGRKPLVVAANLALAALIGITTFVPRVLMLHMVLFFCTMIAVSARVSPLLALMSEMVEGDRRGSLLSLTNGIGQLGLAAGSAVSGPIYETLGYRANTLISMTTGLLVVLLIATRLRERPLKRGPVI
jgi:predicted MFS family arabinose efflux permease